MYRPFPVTTRKFILDLSATKEANPASYTPSIPSFSQKRFIIAAILYQFVGIAICIIKD
ncbi:hypothetical protein C0J52_11190 [Blattella germanica]|nr:hypothetical protein C0J52_11190 [Blattella germanica]